MYCTVKVVPMHKAETKVEVIKSKNQQIRRKQLQSASPELCGRDNKKDLSLFLLPRIINRPWLEDVMLHPCIVLNPSDVNYCLEKSVQDAFRFICLVA